MWLGSRSRPGSVAVGVSLALDGLGAREVQGSAVIISTLLIGRRGPPCRHRACDPRDDTRRQGQKVLLGVRGLGIEPRLRCLNALSGEGVVLAAMEEFMPDGEIPGIEVIAEGLIFRKIPSGVRHRRGRWSQIGDDVHIVGLLDGRIGIRTDVDATGIGHLIRDRASNITSHFIPGRGGRRSRASRSR